MSIASVTYSPGFNLQTINSAYAQYIANGSTTALDALYSSQPWIINGNAGGDTLEGFGNNDTLNGNGGNDILVGGAGNDTLNPGAAAVDINANGYEALVGGAGNDTYNVGPTAAYHYLVAYNDDIFSGGLGGVTVNLATNTATDPFGNTDTLNGIVFVVGTNTADSFTGDTTGDNIAPGGGTDFIDGGTGGDQLDYQFNAQFGRDGFNYIRGIVVTQTADNAGTVLDPTLATDTFINMERVNGTRFADTFNGSAFGNSFVGGAGIDVFNGNGGADEVSYLPEHSAGGNLGVVVNLAARTGKDMFGTTDTLNSIEIVVGSNRNDLIYGDANANALFGMASNDILNGGGGNDTLIGGAGNDYFLFLTALNAATNVDRILDFNVLADTVRLSKLVFTTFSAVPGNTPIAAGAFQANLTGTATEADDRILYDTDLGALYYDADGSGVGAAVRFATVSAGLALTNLDFVVV